jgi:hypothetical protein
VPLASGDGTSKLNRTGIAFVVFAVSLRESEGQVIFRPLPGSFTHAAGVDAAG